jgi:hypothetical protein
MTTKRSVLVLAVLGLLPAGCATPSLTNMFGGGKSTAPQEAAVRTGNNLAMPPDLQLRAPAGEATDEYQPNTVAAAPPAAPLETDVASYEAPPVAARPAPAPDIYQQYGVSRTNPDGTPKDRAKLEEELKAAMMAKKRQANPNYGTVFNIGNIFRDE